MLLIIISERAEEKGGRELLSKSSSTGYPTKVSCLSFRFAMLQSDTNKQHKELELVVKH